MNFTKAPNLAVYGWKYPWVTRLLQSWGWIESITNQIEERAPMVGLQYSDDGGKTWSKEYWKSFGKKGEYKTRVKWNRLGSGRDRMFRIIITDPVKVCITDAYINVAD